MHINVGCQLDYSFKIFSTKIDMGISIKILIFLIYFKQLACFYT